MKYQRVVLFLLFDDSQECKCMWNDS